MAKPFPRPIRTKKGASQNGPCLLIQLLGRVAHPLHQQTNAVEFPGAPSFAPLFHAKGGGF